NNFGPSRLRPAMFFPIRTDRRFKRTPWVNYTLIAVNVLVYALTWQSTQQFDVFREGGYSLSEIFESSPGVALWLWPSDSDIRLYQFITYQFVHSGPEPAPIFSILLPMHLAFNMLFLYVFGNAVEDQMGKAGYLGFYLAGGVLAGLAHILTGGGPVLGASGSVAAVTGAYLALFPLSNVTIAYWLIIFIGSFVVSSMVLILFRVVLDIVFQFTGYGNTAYVAHLAGYLYGFVIGMGLLMLRMLPREPYDLLSLIEQKRRRAQFKKMSREGYHPWDTAPAPGSTPGNASENRSGPGSRSGRRLGQRRADAEPQPSPAEAQLMARRAEISQALEAQDLAAAAERYTRLLQDRPDTVMPQQAQLDLANQLMADGRYDTAARAYELFLQTYRDYAQTPQIQLILGLIYARYFRQPDRARELLTAVRDRLDASERQLADQALTEIA
ncbi:MAG: rhomboid family intramembrane serine protease, partial [Planctomycetota bacterium]